MKETKLSRMNVRDARTAAIFTDPKLRRILIWFVPRPRSVAEAAVALGMDIRRAHHYVTRLAGLGLLVIVETRHRAGRAVKYYRAVAKSFFVPHELAPRGFGDALAQELRTSLAAGLARSDGGILFAAAKGGSPRGKIVGGGAQAVEMWRVLRLRPRALAALRHDLNALLNRYQRAEGGGGSLFLVHAAFAPKLAGEGIADNDLTVADTFPALRG